MTHEHALEPWVLPEKWEWVQLGTLVEHRTGDWGEDPGEDDVDIPVVRSTEMRGDLADLDTAEVRSLSRKKAEELQLCDGDILVNKSSGSAHLVGQPCLVRGVDGRAVVFTNFVIRLRPTSIPSGYLYAYLSSTFARQLMERMQNTTSGLRNLNIGRYLRLPVPVGPPEAVDEASAAFDELLHLRHELRRRSEAVEEVEASLKQRIFSGNAIGSLGKSS